MAHKKGMSLLRCVYFVVILSSNAKNIFQNSQRNIERLKCDSNDLKCNSMHLHKDKKDQKKSKFVQDEYVFVFAKAIGISKN